MASQYFVSLMLLLSHYLVLHCASAAVHSHSIDNVERESDGSYRARDFDHFTDSGHNSEFDHEAILGSVKEAEEFDRLSPEESRRRLGLMLPKMDLNGDQYIDRSELKKWILNSFANLSKEEAQERLLEADENRDSEVTWNEYLQDTFGVDDESEVGTDDTGDTGMLLREEKAMWQAADQNGDGRLDINEFQVFTNPEEHAVMHPFLLNQTLREKDKNHDGLIDFQEYIGDRRTQQDKAWLLSEREKFEHELDVNKDGVLDADEIRQWVVPDNERPTNLEVNPSVIESREWLLIFGDIAEEEVEHLFAAADDDHDERLSYREVLDHHDVFVGSEATDYGSDLLGDHFDDEL